MVKGTARTCPSPAGDTAHGHGRGARAGRAPPRRGIRPPATRTLVLRPDPSIDRPPRDPRNSQDDRGRPEIDGGQRIVDAEGPIHVDEVARRVSAAFGKARTGGRIAAATLEALRHAGTAGQILRDDDFWMTDAQREDTPIRDRSAESRSILNVAALPERPFSRDQRRWVYASSKQADTSFGFGSDQDMERQSNYLVIKHDTFPLQTPVPGDPAYDPQCTIACAKVLGAARGRAKVLSS